MFSQSPVGIEYDGNTPKTPIIPIKHTVEGLTRDVYIKPLHSHNDYWRENPLFDALSVGCRSIESDIWYFPNGFTLDRTLTETTTTDDNEISQVERQQKLYFRNDEIYVGHSEIFLKPINTLFNLYLNPLFQFLQYTNPKTSESSWRDSLLAEKNGVYFNSPEEPVYLWFDFKTEPNNTYKALRPLLQPFIDNNFLAHYDSATGTFYPGPLILTITGNLPIVEVENERVRYVFLDAPLSSFHEDQDPELMKNYSKMCRVASSSLHHLLGGKTHKAQTRPFSDKQKTKIEGHIDMAHKYGLKTRVWGDVTWPYGIRDSHLKDLFKLGSDLLNVDDLKQAEQLFT